MKKSMYMLLVFVMAAGILTGCDNGTGDKNPTEGQNSQMDTGNENESEIDSELASGTETESETEPEPVIQTVTITAAGDCSLGSLQTHGYASSFHEFYDKYGEAYFFANFKEVFEQDDLTLVNLEGVLSNATNRVDKKFNIKGKPEYTGIMTSSSVEAVSLGNNHTQDYGPESLVDTKNALEAAGILYAYNDIVSYYTTDEGLVVAMISAGFLSDNYDREKYLFAGIEEAKNKGADLIITSCHWGIEGDYYPNNYQKKLGHKLIDAGADVVIGHHPHVPQGIEEYKGKLIVYSLGNFSFGGNRNPSEKNTFVFQQTFTFVDGVLQIGAEHIEAKIIPARISGHNNYNDFQPKIATGDQAAKIIKKMNDYSKDYSGVSFDEQGNVLIKTLE